MWRPTVKIRTSWQGKRSIKEALITNEDLGYTEEEWRLLGDGDKEKAIVDWWLKNYISIEHEVIE